MRAAPLKSARGFKLSAHAFLSLSPADETATRAQPSVGVFLKSPPSIRRVFIWQKPDGELMRFQAFLSKGHHFLLPLRVQSDISDTRRKKEDPLTCINLPEEEK